MKERIEQAVHTRWAGKHVIYFDVTDSTNTQARICAENGAPHGTLVIADKQEGGKGRLGRSWVSPSGEGIWMSVLLRPEISVMSASMLTLVMALAAQRGIREVTGKESLIKWPNDLVMGRKKICGILTEMATEKTDIKYVIVGIGINVSQKEFPEELRESATSILLETKTEFTREDIIASVMDALEQYYDVFVRTEDMSGLMKLYNEKLVNRDCQVCVLAPDGDFRGIARGINQTGGLRVELENGNETEVISGEVSVRGVYGYV